MSRFVLESDSLNEPMLNGLRTVLKRVKEAHYTDVIIRINGADERYQADWLKHLIEENKP